MANVLIVEDEVIAAWNIQESLEALGHQVLGTVTTGEQALQTVSAQHPDLVLMDIRLPGKLDGIQTVEAMRLLCDSPIIYLTAHADNMTLERALATTPFGYLTKPFRRKELQTSIDIALTRHHLEKQLETAEQKLAITLNSLGEGAIATDTQGNVAFINPMAEQLTGWEQPAAIGQPVERVMRLTQPETDSTLENPLRHAIETGRSGKSDEQGLLQARDGPQYLIEYTATPILDQRKKLIGGVIIFRDITERRRMEMALRQSEDRYRTATLAGRVGVWDWNLSTNEMYLDPILKEILGYEDTEIANHIDDWSQYVYPPDRPLVQAAVQAHLDGHTHQFEVTHRMMHKDGSLRWIFARGSTIWDIHGSPYRMVGTDTDITAQKQAEEALHQQAAQDQVLYAIAQHIRESLDLSQVLRTTVEEVRQLLQADRVIVYRLQSDKSGLVMVESVDARWTTMQGWRISDPCFMQESCLQKYRQGHIQVISDRQNTDLFGCYDELLGQFDIQANVVASIVVGQQLWGLLGVHQCGTPRDWQPAELDLLQKISTQLAIAIQQAELYQQLQDFNTSLETQVQERTAALQRSVALEKTLQRIADRVRDSLDEHQILQTVVREIGQTLGVLVCNSALYNLDKQESVVHYESTKLDCFYAGRVFQMSNAWHFYDRLLQKHDFQVCSLHPDPERGPVMMFACPIFDNEGVLGDLWLIDGCNRIFEEPEVRLVRQVATQCAIALRQARLYQAAQAQVKELERLNLLKDDFLSTISHELRTPMANIHLATHLLEKGLSDRELIDDTNAADPLGRYIKILKDEGQRESQLISDILEISRLEDEAEDLEICPIQTASWIVHVAEPFVERAKAQRQIFELDVPEDLPVLYSDLCYTDRILSELFNNACKYSPAEATIRVTARQIAAVEADTSPYLEVTVTNTGVTIPAAERDRIFEKFYRIPSNDPWRCGGTGLGLALIKKMSKLLGGSIFLEATDEPTDHVAFVLRLPFHHAAPSR